ncbi:MAG: hypothetical protein CMM50_02385 [Rhodospirillaceae bacterium]|nr:hypothetical protein [Rhodospirillaceae bacterium]
MTRWGRVIGAGAAGVAIFGGTIAQAGAAEDGRDSIPESVFDAVRVGIAQHDANVFGHRKESGGDVALELRFHPLTGEFWDSIWSPRPHFGVNLSTGGDTNQLYSGLTWTWRFLGPLFASLDLGAAVHDGALSTNRPDRKELGARFLFREAVELGVSVAGHHTFSVRVDHISNATLADHNEGLNTLGLLYGYRF